MIYNIIKERLYHRQPVCSFEFFPPKTLAGEQSLLQTIATLSSMSPDFVSVTYGAGGSTRETTRNLVLQIKKQFALEVMPHLTCIGHSPREIEEMLKVYAEHGITNILALRGDPPVNNPQWTNHPDAPKYAIELVKMAKQKFSIGVAGFPEKHPSSPTLESDLIYLKAKVDAGAAFIITQLFFVNDFYFDYVSRARQQGILIPIIPGIMPVTKRGQLEKFRELAGCFIPPALSKMINDCQNDEDAEEIGLAYCAAQCADLLRGGAPGIHFYTLNQSRATLTVHNALRALGYWAR